MDSPADVGQVEDGQSDVVLVAGDVEVILETENLCVSDIGPVEKGTQEQHCQDG